MTVVDGAASPAPRRRARLALRDVTRADLATLFAQQEDPEIGRLAAVPHRGRADFEAHWETLFADPAIRTRAILADGELVGYLVLFTRAGHRQVGYWLGREFWGRGLATRALELFLAEVDDRPLYAHVASRNAASLRVVEKCGFRRLYALDAEADGDRYEDVVWVLDRPATGGEAGSQ